MGRLIAIFLAILVLPGITFAETYLVRPDGTGDFPTIQAAVDGIENGDVIELTDGTFTGSGNRDVHINDKIPKIRSQSGDPTVCIIDCAGATGGMAIYPEFPMDPGFLEGFTISNGARDWGGALLIGQGVELTVTRCIFSGNQSLGNGGAVMLDVCGEATFIECSFIGNDGGVGGALCT